MERAKNVFLSVASRLRARMNREITLYGFLIVIAMVIRFWDVGARAIHYDEGIHLGCSQNILNPLSWCLEPWTHGPFQFYGTSFNFFLFGDSDFAARLLPAIFGTAIVALPYFLRRQIGRRGSLAVATLLAFSPLFLYYSRYARNDIYIAFFMLLLVVCLWRYIEERKARYLYIGAAALSFSFCTKEVSYITLCMLALFLIIVAAKELVARVRHRFYLKGLSAPAEYLILIGTLSLPLFGAFIQLIPGVDLGSGLSNVWAKVLVVFLFAISAAIGLRWNPRRWLISAIIFYGIFIVLYTAFFTNISGFATGVWGNVDYWIEQQGVARGGQPWFYYIMFLPIYEFLPLLFASIGAIYYTIKGNTFSRFLVYWAVMSLVLYSFAGEKMPWLSIHIALPVILLGGMFIGRLLQGFKWRWITPRMVQASTVLALLILFSFTVHVTLEENYRKDDDPPQMLLYAAVSYDVPRVVARINELAADMGDDFTVTVDWDVYYTSWDWYLRDYIRDGKVDHSISQPSGSVLIVSTGNRPTGDEGYLENYGEGEEIRGLIWFPEEYKSGFSIGWWWGYFWDRETENGYGGPNVIVYFPKSSP
ncbi:MAG TPA: flippase activity-associated protein Agl23 [Dehalococcoidia bacterium]|nr:flippase activity-associated protein Agl23 [Dehalococcoidia bacterium]